MSAAHVQVQWQACLLLEGVWLLSMAFLMGVVAQVVLLPRRLAVWLVDVGVRWWKGMGAAAAIALGLYDL